MITQPSIQEYRPEMRISELQAVGLGEKEIGQKAKAVLSFTVVEKTKSYAYLRINHIYIVPSLRR